MNTYRLLRRSGLRGLLRRTYRIEVVGAERIPATGGAILVANHESIWAPFVLGVATEREIHYLAKAELFRRRPLAAVLRSLNAFPVEPGSGDDGAMREASQRLRKGELLPGPARIRIVVGESITVEPGKPTIVAARELTERFGQAVTAA